MSKATVGDLENRVEKLYKSVDAISYSKRQLEVQLGVVCKILSQHLGVPMLDGHGMITESHVAIKPEGGKVENTQ